MDTRNKQKERPDVAGGKSYRLGFVITREWAGLPGAILRFPVRMFLSGELLLRREQTIGLVGEERKAYLLDFRTSVLADALETEPEGFPDFPASVKIKGGADGGEIESTKLSDRARAFFSREDGEGRRIFSLLVEDVVREYWETVTPSPTLPASESSQGGRDTSTTDSAS